MALLNSQYDRIMRTYDSTRAEHARLLDEHTKEAYAKIPRLKELSDRVGTLAAKKIRTEIAGIAGDPDSSSFDEELNRISAEKKALLRAGGFPEDYLEMTYGCPICHDTGFVNGRKCICFRKAEIRLLYDQYELGDILKEENFAHFSFDYYSDTMVNEATGRTAMETAQEACAAARKFTAGLGHAGRNLFIYGNTGVGKTFLTHCIACEALDHSFSTLYFSAHDFFEILAKAEFSRQGASSSYEEMIFDCDLLIIDDLGTELLNSLVSTQLFRVINSRILKKHSTIISTNLGLREFADHYSERTFSRITSDYQIINLIGEDIRLQKKFQGGTK